MGVLGHGAQVMTGIHPLTRANARKLRHEMTREERKLWAKLRELNRMLGLHFRRQAPIGPFIADFADLGRRLVIEVDGGGHGGPRDVARDEWLASQGFRVLRFWNPEVSGNIEGVMQVIFDAIDGESLAEGVPPPPSPPHGGEGRLLGSVVCVMVGRMSFWLAPPHPIPPPRGGREALPLMRCAGRLSGEPPLPLRGEGMGVGG